LHGIFSALYRVLSEKTSEDFGYLGLDVTFVRYLTEATLAAPLESDMHVAFRMGVRLVVTLCDRAMIFEKGDPQSENGRPTNGVRKFLKQFSISFCAFYGADTADWDSPTLTPEQQMLIEAFPIIWQGAIDSMFPLFFRRPVVYSEFNRTFLTRLCGWSRVRFVSFIRDHHILSRLAECASTSPIGPLAVSGGQKVRAMNPQVWKLARFIATGLLKNSDPQTGGPAVPYAVPDDGSEEYERFSLFVVDHVLPYFDQLATEQARNLVNC
jgi:hypothetical protein